MEDENSGTTTAYPKDIADLLARIQDEWSALMSTIKKLTPQQVDAADPGGWAVKDHLAHLAAWEGFMIRCYLGGQPPHEAMGINEATFASLGEDGINALIYARDKDRPFQEVLADINRSHQEVLATLESMDFTDLKRPRFADDPEKRPLLDWVIGNTYDHYQEHRRTIEGTLEEA